MMPALESYYLDYDVAVDSEIYLNSFFFFFNTTKCPAIWTNQKYYSVFSQLPARCRNADAGGGVVMTTLHH